MTSADLAARLRSLIADGIYAPGERIPTVQELMITYEVKSRATLDRALRDLESEGLITRRHGSGMFVRERGPITRDLIAGLKLEHRRAAQGDTDGGLFEAMTATKVDVAVEYAEIPAPKRAAEALGLPASTEVLKRRFRYVGAEDGRPHQVTRSYLPLGTARAANLTGPESEVPGTGTMAQLRQAGIGIDRVRLHLESRMPTAGETADLEIPPGTPVFELWRTMFSGDTAAEVSVGVVPGDRIAYVLNVDLDES